MRLYGGNRVPAHFRARSIVPFEMIRMQLNQSRRQEVAFHILADTGCAGGNIDDLAVNKLQGTENDIVGEYDAGITQNRFISHCLRPPNRS